MIVIKQLLITAPNNHIIDYITCLTNMLQKRSQAGAKAGNACFKNQFAQISSGTLQTKKVLYIRCTVLQTFTICHGQTSRLTRIA